MKRVFVSYSRHNQDTIAQLVHDLSAVGIDTWFDQTLTGGQRWWDNILANIRECDIFIFAVSPESLDSEACMSELGYVNKLGKPILPVVIAKGINKNLLPHPLREIETTDCLNGDKESIFALLKCIMSASATPPLPDPLPDAPPVPVSYLTSLNDRIESTNALSSQDQITLLFELEEEVREGRSREEVRDLLIRLKKRDDLLAKIATKIDEALKNLGELDQKVSKITAISDDANEHEPAVAAAPFCTQCGTQFDANSRFCAKCGAELPETRMSTMPATVARPNAPNVSGSKTRQYACKSADLPRLIDDVKAWLESEDFEAQQMSMDNQGLLLQIKKRGSWRDWVCMGTSLNILFNQKDDTLVVQIGAGKLLDKAAAGTVSLFILWPLAITAGYGAWEQMKMPERIFDFVGSRLTCR